jgi:formate hydrogenlyase subunit 6/NADH:ubiquinone oxidoreductase subunit I
MKFSMLSQVFSQMFKKPFTNRFPAKYAPKNTTKFLEEVGAGRAEIIPPIEVPDGFRGKIQYDKDKCIGCKLCIKVCPSEAIEFIEENKKIKIYLSRCTFCSQCNDICPVKCLSMSKEFLLADSDKYSKDLIVE